MRKGTIRRGETVAWCRHDGSIERVKVSELYVTEALERVEAGEAGAGRDHLGRRDPRDHDRRHAGRRRGPAPLPVITVDEPSLSVTIGINTSPLAGQDGSFLTARQVKARLERELVGNVSLRISRPSVPTCGRSRGAASWRWRCWWS